MIDENILIKVFENRIDTFLKQHPDQKDCVAVQGQREIIQFIEAEAKRQEAERREHIKSFECKLLGRLDDIKESKEAFCDEQEEKCGLYDSCFNCLIGGIVDLIKQLEDEQEYSYANFDEYVDEVSQNFDAEYNDRFCDGIKQAIMVIRTAFREKMPRIMEYVVTK